MSEKYTFLMLCFVDSKQQDGGRSKILYHSV